MRIGVTAFLTDEAMGPVEFAVAAEERGFASIYLPEHTHLPVSSDAPPALVRGVSVGQYRRSLDPFVALGAAAAATTNLRLGTGVCLVAQHDPIVLAKTVATLDVVSRGRFVFGMGFGWNEAELAGHGVAYSSRRAVAREHVLCMQALWADDVAQFHGEFVNLDPCYSWPKPVQSPRPPVLVGGGRGPKLFAAIAQYADGWMPIGGAGLSASLPELRRAFEDAGRNPDSIEVVPFGTLPDPGKLGHLAALGCCEVVLRVPAGSAEEMLPLLDDFAAFVGRY